MKTSIILLAAGTGERFGKPKHDLNLAGKALLQWNLELLKKLPFLHELIVVRNGGKTRHESVKIGLKKAKGEIVIIHNVANPMATVQDFVQIRDVLIKKDAACFVGQKIVDTVRRMGGGRSVTIPRDHLWRVQTPQGFRRRTLLDAIKRSKHPPADITDEMVIFENIQRFQDTPIIALETSTLNQKITVPEDLAMMERYLSTDVRVGIGEDSHEFDTRGTLVIGGVKIPGYPKLKANSDGDVVLHALCNALRSAMGKGSFSKIADPMWKKGIQNSKKYVHKIIKQYRTAGRQINNVAISITCQKPKIDPVVPQMKKSLSRLLDLDSKGIGIVATTQANIKLHGDIPYIKVVCTVTLSHDKILLRRL